jgi:hypothetical protein
VNRALLERRSAGAQAHKLGGPLTSSTSSTPTERDTDAPTLGARIEIGGHAVLCGTCSWTDKTLVQETDWYPQRTMSAQDRLQFYAAQFPVTEVDATYYAPPAEQQASCGRSGPLMGFASMSRPTRC